MLAYVKENNVQSAAVIGGGLLGLEAAKAVADMKVESHIIEFANILMCRQVRSLSLTRRIILIQLLIVYTDTVPLLLLYTPVLHPS